MDVLCNIISQQTGSLLNADKIANTFASVKHENVDKITVTKYLQYFMDAFLLREAKRYDIRRRKEIGADKKYYFTDLGLRNARLNFAYNDDGLLLENTIYNELIYNDFSVNVGTFDTVKKTRPENPSARQTRLISMLKEEIRNAIFRLLITFPRPKQGLEN